MADKPTRRSGAGAQYEPGDDLPPAKQHYQEPTPPPPPPVDGGNAGSPVWVLTDTTTFAEECPPVYVEPVDGLREFRVGVLDPIAFLLAVVQLDLLGRNYVAAVAAAAQQVEDGTLDLYLSALGEPGYDFARAALCLADEVRAYPGDLAPLVARYLGRGQNGNREVVAQFERVKVAYRQAAEDDTDWTVTRFQAAAEQFVTYFAGLVRIRDRVTVAALQRTMVRAHEVLPLFDDNDAIAVTILTKARYDSVVATYQEYESLTELLLLVRDGIGDDHSRLYRAGLLRNAV